MAAAQAAQAAFHNSQQRQHSLQQQLRYTPSMDQVQQLTHMMGAYPQHGHPGTPHQDDFRFEPNPAAAQQMGMQPRATAHDLYAMQQHLAMNPSNANQGMPISAPIGVQPPPSGPAGNGAYPPGLGRPPSQQAQRLRTAPVPTRSPAPQQPPTSQPRMVSGQVNPALSNGGGVSYYPASPAMLPPHSPHPYYQQQQHAQQAAQAAQAVLHATQYAQPSIPAVVAQGQPSYMGQVQAGPSRGMPATQQPGPGPRPLPPSRQTSSTQVPLATASQQAIQLQSQQAAAQAHRHAQNQQAGMAAAAAAAAAAAPRPVPTFSATPGGVAMMRLLQYSDLLSSAMQVGTLEALQQFVDDYFTLNATAIYSLLDPLTDQTKHFEIPACAIPRFLLTLAESGVRGHILAYDSPREYQQATGQILTGYQVECPRVTYITTYANGTQVSSTGQQRARFVRVARPAQQTAGMTIETINALPPLLKLEQVEYVMTGHQQSIMRDRLLYEPLDHVVTSSGGVLPAEDKPTANGEVNEQNDDEGSASGASQGSSSGAAKGKGRANGVVKGEANGEGALSNSAASATNDAASEEGGSEGSRTASGSKSSRTTTNTTQPPSTPTTSQRCYRTILPELMTGPFGLTERSLRCLEIAESVSQLRPLVMYSLQNRCGPLEALHRYTSEIASSNPSMQRFLSGEDTSSPYAGAGPMPPQPYTAAPPHLPPSTPVNGYHAHTMPPTSSKSGSNKRKAPPPPVATDARSPSDDYVQEGESPLKTAKAGAPTGRARGKSMRSNA